MYPRACPRRAKKMDQLDPSSSPETAVEPMLHGDLGGVRTRRSTIAGIQHACGQESLARNRRRPFCI